MGEGEPRDQAKSGFREGRSLPFCVAACYAPAMQPTDTQSAQSALAEIDRQLVELANERHKLLTETPRPVDADARLATLSGKQAALKAESDEIHAEFGGG